MLRMRPILFFLASSSVFAAEQKSYPDARFLNSGIPVIDIRTPGEWRQTGIVKGSKTLMAFDEQGNFDAERFLLELDRVIDKEKPFAIICRTGRRTGLVAAMLDKHGYQVIDLQGGITHVKKLGLPLAPYRP